MPASKAAGQQPIVIGNKDGWPIWHLLYNVIDQYAADRRRSPASSTTTRARRTSPRGSRTATEKVVEWKDAGYLRDDVNAIAQADAGAGFRKGKALFFPAGSWEAGDMPDNIGFFLTPPLEEGEHVEGDRLVRLLVAHRRQQRQRRRRRCVPRLDVQRGRRPRVLRRR